MRKIVVLPGSHIYTQKHVDFFADMLVLGRGDKCINPCRLSLAENLILEENKN
jgi:hypothetical protein